MTTSNEHHDPSPPSAYAAAGVDIAAGEEAVRLIAPLARSTFTAGVLGDIGGFGGLFRLDGYREPVLVSSADGVGTKLRIALAAGSYASVGADMVNHSVNDIWVQGADPLFFLDYIAGGSLNPAIVAAIVGGMSAACKEVGCALIGGETAEMPGVYRSGDYDIAGFIVGAVERYDLINGSGVRPGDALVGLPSSGLHTNGYSLVRRAFDIDGNSSVLDTYYDELGSTLGEALLAVHRSYYRCLKPMQHRLRAMAHITGGGIVGNLPRVLPSHVQAVVHKDSWDVPPLFRIIQQAGGVDEPEMFRVFNMGIGLVAIVRPADAAMVSAVMDGARVIGEVTERPADEGPIRFV
ncbi:MAG: phosphoribosylformylglycinamidine cyclo-ligase [Chloroflexi bacterium]|nr:phosphoribosylformylglycinamidine cyclo-ligase [Chloroflexota bacterium]